MLEKHRGENFVPVLHKKCQIMRTSWAVLDQSVNKVEEDDNEEGDDNIEEEDDDEE